ncbi:hypothetical protein T4A_880 [Trichinella pseudospiralis]|uniref:Uncharacterized protein n=1 Tax=Trichinella pseudospiralis TaxID=6337 RepID=A0A0V1E5G8_TRIPS|nr:hypothetical protein T4A_880 [Trichinella pseudospiralis]
MTMLCKLNISPNKKKGAIKKKKPILHCFNHQHDSSVQSTVSQPEWMVLVSLHTYEQSLNE